MQEEAQNNLQQSNSQIESSPVFPEKSKNNNSLIYLIIIFILLAIIGFLSFKYVFGEKLMSSFLLATPTIQAVATPTVAVDPTANWKTYSNNKFNFSIKYPSDMYLADIERLNLVVIQKEPIDLALRTHPYLGALTIKYGAQSIPLEWLNGHNTTIGGVLAYLQGNRNISSESNYYFSEITVSRSSIIYDINFPNLDNKGNHDKIFDQILSTFKFTNSDETANWKTYRNSFYNIQMQYPSNWNESINPTGTPQQEEITFLGTEGSIVIYTGGGFGGGPCNPNEHKNIQTGMGVLGFCVSIFNSDKEIMRVANEGPAPTNFPSVNIRAEINKPIDQNEKLFYQILSTFKFL